MNEIVNKFLLAEDKFIPEMHLRQPGFTYNASGSFTKNKEYNNSDKQEIQDIFIETNYIRLALWLWIWLMEILRICPEEQLLVKYYVMKHLILLKIRNKTDIKEVLL